MFPPSIIPALLALRGIKLICSSQTAVSSYCSLACLQIIQRIMHSSMFLGFKAKLGLAHNCWLVFLLEQVLCLHFHSAHTFSCVVRWELVFLDAISQRKSCEAHNHINVRLHIFSQLKPELTVSWHRAVIFLHPWPKGFFYQPAVSGCLWPWVGMVTSSPGVIWHGNLLSPVCLSSFMPWDLWLHSPGHYPLTHPHPSVKDQTQACPMGTGVPKWAWLPSSITTVNQGDFQQKNKRQKL